MEWNGAIIRTFARDYDYSLVDLAREVGVTRQALDKWINGSIPKGKYLVKLAEVFHCHPNEFFAEDYAISMPQHRMARNLEVDEETQAASTEIAEKYLSLFRKESAQGIKPVLDVDVYSDANAKMVGDALRAIVELDDEKPMDLHSLFKLADKLGIFIIFFPMPKTKKTVYGFFSNIHSHRVIFVNTKIKGMDLIFYILHEVVHAIRDDDLATDPEVEAFCDAVASYAQFPLDYVTKVFRLTARHAVPTKLKILRDISIQNLHSVWGITKRIREDGHRLTPKLTNTWIGAENQKIAQKYKTLDEVLFTSDSVGDYLETIAEATPKFWNLVVEIVPRCSVRKLGEWLGLDNSMDAKEAFDWIVSRKARNPL